MNPDLSTRPVEQLLMTRREALRRTALMLGVAVTPSLISGVMQAQSVAANVNASPRFLTRAQFATAAAIAERILPKTDTPGAADVGVPAFIDLMYGKYMTAAEKEVFAAGLDEVGRTQPGFSTLSLTQQDDVLTRIAHAAQPHENTFFHLMKELTLLGYFTSEPIGKNVLHYDPIPGRYDGCIPLSDVGKTSWTR
jgi:gluconate 2-dehydrogenase gamma chain